MTAIIATAPSRSRGRARCPGAPQRPSRQRGRAAILRGVRFLPHALALLAACAPPQELPQATGRPDVVILLVDDLGWADVGYHEPPPEGGPATPRIDALARSGLRLERFYAQPSCTPTRAGLFTARLPVRMGIRSNLGIRSGPGASSREAQAGLPLEERVLARDFRAAGYRTALVGKWHLGEDSPAEHPNARGFDHFYGHLGGMIDYTRHVRKGGTLDWQRNGEPLREPGYSTHLIAAEAERILDGSHDTPLFLCVSFNAPHAPLHEPPGHEPPGRPARGNEDQDPRRVLYSAMVEELDRAIGTVLDAIDARGTDTLVLFLSDNGGAPKSGGCNDPLRGRKFQVFEGAIRVPAVVRWPGHVPEGALSEQLVTCMDVLPTLADAAGVPLRPDEEHPLDGTSVWPELTAGRLREREPEVFVCEMPEESNYAAFDGRWKLVARRTKDGPLGTRLYDLETNPGELVDVADEHPEMVARLWRTLGPWVR